MADKEGDGGGAPPAEQQNNPVDPLEEGGARGIRYDASRAAGAMATFDAHVRIKPTQKTKSDELFKCIQGMLTAAGKPLDSFNEVYGVLIVPSMLLLEEQTIDRLSQAQTYLCVEDDPMKHVFKAVSIKDSLGKRLDELAGKIKKNSNTLFLVVEDEAHTALQGKDGSMKRFIYDRLRPHENENVFRLLVTATPQALVAVTEKLETVTWDDLPELQFSQWRDHVIDETQRFYVGLMFYKAALDAYENEEKGLYRENLTMEEDNVPRAYLQATRDMITAMKSKNKPSSTTFTHHVVQRLFQRPGMAVVRIEKHVSAQKFQDDMLAIFGKEKSAPFLVLLDTSASKTLREQISDQKDALQESTLKSRACAVAEMTKEPVYSDLEGLRVLLLIVDKGKMGMTFPDSMFCWDLRQRYRKILSEATFVQDAGRCFAWRKPTEIPLLLVNFQARQAVRQSPEIWLTGKRYKPDNRLSGGVDQKIEAWVDSDGTDQIDEAALWAGQDDPDYVPPPKKLQPTTFFHDLLRKHFIAKGDGALDLVTTHSYLYPKNRTLLFCARPQVGKTGTFLRLWFLLRQYVTVKPVQIFLSFPDDNYVTRLPVTIEKNDKMGNNLKEFASQLRPCMQHISAVQRRSDKKNVSDLDSRDVRDGDVFDVKGELCKEEEVHEKEEGKNEDEDEDEDGMDASPINVFGDGEFMELHRKLNKMSSSDLHQQLEEDTAEWRRYHELYGQQRLHWKDELPYEAVCRAISETADEERDTVVDLGCGEALLARDLLKKGLQAKNLYCVDHCYQPLGEKGSHDYFDASAAGCNVVQHDISDHALSNSIGAEHDFVVLCLALMGKNWPTYLVTAAELLKTKGTLVIAEPNSKRPEHITQFLGKLGFTQVSREPLGARFHLYRATKSKSKIPVRQESRMLWNALSRDVE